MPSLDEIAPQGNPTSTQCRWCNSPRRKVRDGLVCLKCDYTLHPITRKRVGPRI